MTSSIFDNRSASITRPVDQTNHNRRGYSDHDGHLPSGRNGHSAEPAIIEVGGRQLTTTDLDRFLTTLPVIEQSKGLLMGYYGIDADRAFNLLRGWSQKSNVRLSAISAQLVDAATATSATPFDNIKRVLDELNSGKIPAAHHDGTAADCPSEM